MKRTTLVLLLLLASQTADAQPHRRTLSFTHVPPIWLLDRGPRVIHPYDYEPSTSDRPSPSLAVPFHAKTPAEAASEARAQARQCLPVRVTTEDGSFLHAPSECR